MDFSSWYNRKAWNLLPMCSLGGSRVLQEGSLGLLSSGLGVRVTVGGFLLEAAGPT